MQHQTLRHATCGLAAAFAWTRCVHGKVALICVLTMVRTAASLVLATFTISSPLYIAFLTLFVKKFDKKYRRSMRQIPSQEAFYLKLIPNDLGITISL